MYLRSRDIAVNLYWTDLTSIRESGFLPFQLEGAVAWEEEDAVARGKDVELISAYYEMNGKHILDNPVMQYRQQELGRYIINGKLWRAFRGGQATEVKPEIEGAIEDLGLLAGFLSWCFGMGMDWRPARYLQVNDIAVMRPEPRPSTYARSWRFFGISRFEQGVSHAVVSTPMVGDALARYDAIRSAIPEADRRSLAKCFSWFRSALMQDNPLIRYISLFQSVESLVDAVWRSLPQAARREPSSAEGYQQVCAELAGLDESNYRGKVRRAYNLSESTSATKFRVVDEFLCTTEGRTVDASRASRFKEFSRARGPVAHGGIADSEPDRIPKMATKCHELLLFAYEWISRVVEHAVARGGFSSTRGQGK